MAQDGYISGETLIGAEKANRIVIIRKWESIDAWNKWKKDDARKK
jgi:heme-degrading monooxygenase HmoA